MSRDRQRAMRRRREWQGVLTVLICVFWTLYSPAYSAAKVEEKYLYKAVLLQEPAPVRIDGDLSDWNGLEAEVQVMHNICTIISGQEILSQPSSRDDLSGSFRCVVDPENFYVAVEVKDDRRVFGEAPFGAVHLDDSVEIYFDGDRVPHEYKEGVSDYDANDAEVRFSKGKDGNVHFEGMGLFGEILFMFPGLWESLGIEGAIQERPWGYIAELKVPKIVFVAAPLRPGLEVGFQVMVNDDDDGGSRDSKISWTADLKDESWNTTRYFGRLTIEKYAEVSEIRGSGR